MSYLKFKNLSKPFRLTKQEDDFVKLIQKLAGHDSWDKDLKAYAALLPANYTALRLNIKNKIKKQLEVHQEGYCIYCGIHFDIVGVSEREHIANKAKYPQFTYARFNIALSCSFCNGTMKKGQKNTITSLEKLYKKCSFNIRHPFFDKFEDHIEASLRGSNLFFSPVNGSTKGYETIKMFDLMNGIQAQLRGAAVIKHLHEKNILPKYDPTRVLAISNTYIM